MITPLSPNRDLYTTAFNPDHWSGPRWELRDGPRLVDGGSKKQMEQQRDIFQQARDRFNEYLALREV